MPGRPFIQDDAALPERYSTDDARMRRNVLRETILRFENCPTGDRYLGQAKLNLARWKSAAHSPSSSPEILVLPGDWGEVTQGLTKRFGQCFAMLNMANAYVPGGAYVEGAIAQEENMYRRTDCHFYILPPHYDVERDRYSPEATQLLSGEHGYVCLDSSNPRVCIRGPEDRESADLGYPWLESNEIFPFFELKAAAQDLRRGASFNADQARRQIRAQIKTLSRAMIRHVVFGAFGCGAFKNPAEEVAKLYKEELTANRIHFDVVAFAIFDAGYGPDNYRPFKTVLGTT